MRNSLIALIIFALISTAINAKEKTEHNLKVFTVISMPFSGKNINDHDVCYLDFTQKALKDVNDIVMRTTSERELEGALDKGLFNKISENTICRSDAANLNIKKVPAVVLDNKVVIYGERNIDQALRIAREALDES